MQVLLRMNPGLEMWFGEWDWIDWYEDDEDWPEEGWSFSFYSPNLLSPISFNEFLVSDFLVAEP